MRITAVVGAVVVLGMNNLLLGADDAKERVQVTRTERINFPAGGVLRLKKSAGEVTIEGSDRSDVEITTIKSTVNVYDAKEREKASHDLDAVKVTAKRYGNEIVITSEFPKHTGLVSSPFGPEGSFYLEYRIKVPRNTRLIVDHGSGEVHVDDVTGDIQARATQGDITVHLPPDGRYAIDARSDIGSVDSDFPGQAKRRRWLVGHQFTEDVPNASQKLHLHIGYGSIVILQIRTPVQPAAALPGPARAAISTPSEEQSRNE